VQQVTVQLAEAYHSFAAACTICLRCCCTVCTT